jgi:signal transduction histidine kinase
LTTAASTLLFTDEGSIGASDPLGSGFGLRERSPEVQRLFLHALGRFAIPGGWFVPRAQARVLAGVAARPITDDLLVLPIDDGGRRLGVFVLHCDAAPGDDELSIVRAYVDAAAKLLATADAAAASRRESRDSRVLALVDERMRRSLDRRDMHFAIADAVREGFDASRCAIVERSVADGERVNVLAVADDASLENSLPSWMPLPAQLRRVFAGASLRAEDHDALAESFGVERLIAVPLVREGRVEQILTLGFPVNRALTEGDVNALRAVGVHVGLALANTRLYERERARRARAESLERIVRILRDSQSLDEVLLVFVIAVSHELPLDGAIFSIQDDVLVRRASRSRATKARGVPERIAIDLVAPYLSVEEPSDAMLLPHELRVQLFGDRHGVAVPLRVDGALWGLLSVTIDSELAEWPPDEKATFFRTLGSHLELAIANAAAFDREQRRAVERATLAEAARSILGFTTIVPLADAMCRLASDLVHADSTCAVRIAADQTEVIGRFGGRAAEMVRHIQTAQAERTNGDVAIERRMLRVAEGPGFAAIPLAHAAKGDEQEPVRLYLVVDRENGERFSRDDLRLLLELGALFALALRNLELYEETRHANDALRESSEFKGDLIAMLAHDFKGPLAVVSGYCELLLETLPDHREQIETIFTQTQRLVRLSEDALVLAQTQSDGFSLARTDVDFGAFVANSVESIARSTGRIRTNVPDTALPVSLDPQRFGHVLDNVLSNALKYSDAQVELTIGQADGRAFLKVTDRGIGIPADEMKTIFTRFGRASNARRGGIEGSGVGLYVSRKIVEVHRGTISVESVEGEGSTFIVTLPLVADAVTRATEVALPTI